MPRFVGHFFKIMSVEKKIIEFLKQHDEIKVDRVSKKAGMPEKCLARVVSGKQKLPKKHLDNLLRVLGGIGFVG